MGVEIERKYLVKRLPELGAGTRIVQGYLSFDPTVRVRLKGSHGRLTIKSRAKGIARAEYEYEIPSSEAEELLKLCKGHLIEKTRYVLDRIELDVFDGDNKGLIVAEIELAREDERVELPDWIDREVTEHSRYYNSALAIRPYKKWTKAERFDE